jgi:ribokinase
VDECLKGFVRRSALGGDRRLAPQEQVGGHLSVSGHPDDIGLRYRDHVAPVTSAAVPAADVVVVGSVNVDHIVRVARLPAPGTTVTGGTFTLQTGGKSANQAVAAARFGARVALVAAVGDDALGRGALEALGAEGVGTESCLTIAGLATGIALIVVDADGENQIAVASGANGELDAGRVLEALAGVTARPGGVCLLGFEVGDEALVAAAEWAAGHGLSVIVNPAPYRAIPPSLLAARPLLTPNRSEAREAGGADEPGDAARRLAGLAGGPVIVTLGADGALLVAEPDATPEHLEPWRVSVVDATGAGDAFNGILAAELASGAPLREAARWAMAGAALSTRASGAQAGLPRRHEAAALLGL